MRTEYFNTVVVNNLIKMLREKGGFSYRICGRGRHPSKGFAVACGREFEMVIEPELVQTDEQLKMWLCNYVAVFRDELADMSRHLGAWFDDGRLYLDISEVWPERTRAIALGKLRGQLASYDIGEEKEIRLDDDAKAWQVMEAMDGRR